jgi:hypothetical protein
MKRGNKRGQFYLVAGMIIISIIIGFVAVVNYVKKSHTVIIDDLKEEVEIESQKLLENKLAQGGDPIHQYGLDYSSHLGSEIEVYFITGDAQIIARKYVNGDPEEVSSDVTVDGGIITFELNDALYEFDQVSGENFYFLIAQEIKGEYFVVSG